jgi:hypothetical protein
MTEVTLRRYTNLAATLYLLDKRAITLLNPGKWDDENDSFFLKEYMTLRGYRSIFAACFAQSHETYHHWKVFSPGMDGVCIHFKKSVLINSLEGDDTFLCGSIDYKLIKKLRKAQIPIEKIPLLKRFPYEHEKEFRIITMDSKSKIDSKDYNIDLACIEKISLSPWIPRNMISSVRKTIQLIPGCGAIDISRSSVRDNMKWKAEMRIAISRTNET